MDRLLTTLADCLTRESAERVVNLRMDAETRAWVEDLASKANEGLLSESERSEYIAYIEVMDWIATLQAKARAMLTGSPKP